MRIAEEQKVGAFKMSKTRCFALVSALLVAAGTSPAIAESAARLPPDRPPSLMTSTEIRAFNEGLDSGHPYYIRCKKEPVVGSLVRKFRVCRTKDEWKSFAAMGNDTGREILGDVSIAPHHPGGECPANRC